MVAYRQINQEPMVASPGFANEKKVEHLAVINELYTKAYELFKKYSSMLSEGQGQGRLTLWIAYRIAQTYYDAGKFNMAVRSVSCSFNERQLKCLLVFIYQ